jgi:hypothetical protein
MARRTAPPGRPPTLDELAHQAVGIDSECRDCGHKVLLGFELFLGRYGAVPFPEFVRLLKCSGSRNVFGRPRWPKRYPGDVRQFERTDPRAAGTRGDLSLARLGTVFLGELLELSGNRRKLT